MSNSKKWIIVLLAALVTVLCGSALAACNSDSVWRNAKKGTVSGLYDPNNPNGDSPFYFEEGMDPNQFAADEDTYVLTVTSKGGLPLSDVEVKIKRAGVEIADVRSDKNGQIKLAIPAGNYDISYEDLPDGYFVDDDTVTQLSINNKKVVTRLNSAIIEKAIPAGHVFRAGEVMYDFTYYDSDNYEIQLKELLKDYKCVLINFFYTTCGPCIAEFPAMSRAYEQYKKDIYIVSLDPLSSDTVQMVADFKAEGYMEGPTGSQVNMPFNFFMAKDNQGLYQNHFNTGAYPTNVFVDRYGVIASIDMGSRTSDEYWIDMFKMLSADDYVQNSTLIEDSVGNEGAPLVKPPEGLEMPSDEQMTEAAVDGSMLQGGDNQYADLPLHFYGPNKNNPEEANDAENTWPYLIGSDAEGKYIYPGNVGTDNTHAILYTDIFVDADQFLSLEYKLNTKDSDYLYIVLNQTLNQDLILSGSTGDQWIKLDLYTATRPANIKLNFIFTKDSVGTQENEFVGIRNIKVSNIEADTDKPVDVLTEMARYKNGQWEYQKYYLNQTDGLYHMGDGTNPDVDDPIIYFNAEEETAWSENHLKDFDLTDSDGIQHSKSVYNIAFYKHNEPIELISNEPNYEGQYDTRSLINIPYDPNEVIVDSHYIQYFSSNGCYVPVTAETAEVLKAFTKKVYEDSECHYVGQFDEEHTWLELCFYYRMFNPELHKDPEHFCLATNIPAEGLTISFAKKIESGADVSFTAETVTEFGDMTERDQVVRGLYYTFTAPGDTDGVYKITIAKDPQNKAEGIPRIIAWNSIEEAYVKMKKVTEGGEFYVQGKPGEQYIWATPLVEFEGYTTEKDNLVIYLKAGQTIYLQMSELTDGGTNHLTYNVNIKHYAAEDWVLSDVGYGYIDVTEYQTNIDITQWNEDNPDGKTYWYHVINGEYCSPVFIDFTKPAEFDGNGRSLEQMLNENFLDFRNQTSAFDGKPGKNYNDLLKKYYNSATQNIPENERYYGLIKADKELTDLLQEIIQFLDEYDLSNTLAWTMCGRYYRYLGPDSNWKPLPEEGYLPPADKAN